MNFLKTHYKDIKYLRDLRNPRGLPKLSLGPHFSLRGHVLGTQT